MTKHPTLELFVEGEDDAEIVSHLLRRAKFNLDSIQIVAAGDMRRMRDALGAVGRHGSGVSVALVEMEARSVPDAQERARRELGNPAAEVFCAVPTTAAWLFADTNALLKCVDDDRTREIVARLPLPEEIPFPRELAQRVFRDWRSALRVLDQMSICDAAARSPSLHAFLRGLARITGNRVSLPEDVHARSVGRDTFSNLIAEILPAESIIYRTIDGSYTAGEMIREVRDGTELGRQYSSDLLRISRDFLARQAQRDLQR
jgi:hypothetical protein